MTIIRTFTPIVRIISGYSRTGKLGGCRAFEDGGNTDMIKDVNLQTVREVLRKNEEEKRFAATVNEQVQLYKLI